jgi:hypothetical protein
MIIRKRLNIMDQAYKLIEKGAKFIGGYESYTTKLIGNNTIEAIKDFYNCYNSTLKWVYDVENSIMYVGRENDEPDVRGYYNYSYYKVNTDELLFNVDELTKPIVIIKPVKNDGSIEHAWVDRYGHIFKCGFERHRHLADELFLSKTIQKPEKYNDITNNDEVLIKMGWIRISSKRINFNVMKLSESQKKFIREYIDIMGDENYKFRYGIKSKDEILKFLDDL